MASVSRMNKKLSKCSNNFLNESWPCSERYTGPWLGVLQISSLISPMSDNHESGFGNPKVEDRRYSCVGCPEQFASMASCIVQYAHSGQIREAADK
jgi:hypothetical protein